MPMSPTLLVPRDSYDPLSESTLRAAWLPSGKLNGSATALANGENLATWNDYTGTYNCTTAGGTAPTGLTSGSAVVADPNAAGCIVTATGALPDDTAGTVAVLAMSPSSNVAGRDFDTPISFGAVAATTIWLHPCIRRVSTVLRMGFSAQNGGSFSAWHGTTTSLSLDTWYRFIWTFTGSAMEMYVNGVAQSITNDTAGGVTTGQWMGTVTNVTNVCLMGRRRSSGYDEFWDGPFDQAWWFSSAFSAGKVADLDSYLASQAARLA